MNILESSLYELTRVFLAPVLLLILAALAYLTPEEIAAEDAEASVDGICSHGLDFWTCPKGCFG